MLRTIHVDRSSSNARAARNVHLCRTDDYAGPAVAAEIVLKGAVRQSLPTGPVQQRTCPDVLAMAA